MAVSNFASPIWWSSFAWPGPKICCGRKLGCFFGSWMPLVAWCVVLQSSCPKVAWGFSQRKCGVPAYFVPYFVIGLRQLFQPVPCLVFCLVMMVLSPKNMHRMFREFFFAATWGFGLSFSTIRRPRSRVETSVLNANAHLEIAILLSWCCSCMRSCKSYEVKHAAWIPLSWIAVTPALSRKQIWIPVNCCMMICQDRSP